MSEELVVDEKQHAKRESKFSLLKLRTLTEQEKLEVERRKRARKQHKKEVQTEKKQAKEQSKLEKDRLLYAARREQTKLVLNELRRRRPAADALIKDFETALSEAAVLFWEGKPEEALSRLKKLDPSKAVEKADKLWGEANDQARKRSPGGMEAVKQINLLLADKDLPLTAGEVAAFKREQNLAARPLLAEAPGSQEVEQATEALLDLQQRVEQRIADAGDQLYEIERLYKDVRLDLEAVAPLSGTTPPLLTDRESAPMRLALASARTSIDARDFDAAAQTLQPMQVELQDILKRIGPLRAQWLQAERELPARLDEARKLAAAAKSPPVRQAAVELRDRLQQLGTLGVGKAIGYDDALGRVGGAAATLQRLAEQEKAWLTFQGDPSGEEGGGGALMLAQQNIEQDFEAVAEALHRLHKKVLSLTKGKHKSAADGPFIERRDALREEWKARCKTAHDEDSLDAFGMGVMLNGLRMAIDELAADERKLGAAVADGKLARAKAEFVEAQSQATAACEEYVGLDAADGARALAELEQLVDAARQQNDAAFYRFTVVKLGDLRQRLRSEQGERLQEVKEAQQALQGLLEPMQAQLTEIQRLAEKAKSGEKQAPLLALLETLRGEYDALRAMGKLTQLPLLEGAQADAERFAQELTSSLAAAKGEGGEVMSFAEVRKKLANLKVDLEDKDFKLYCTSTQFTLAEDLKALEKALGTTSMPKLSEQLNALAERVEAMEKKAEQAKKATKDFEKSRVAELLQQLAAKAFDDAPKAKAALKARIKALVGEFQFEDGQDVARRKAVELETEMTQLLLGERDERGVPKALAAQEAAALKAENDGIVEKGKWEGESKVLDKRLTELEKINPGEIKALQDMLDSAKKSVEKSEDYAAGRDQLQAIRNRLSLIEANPRGLAITARNKLPQVNARYRRAVAGFVKALGEVEQAVAKLPATDLDDPGKALVKDQLAGLRGLFNASAFEAVVASMTDKTQSREARSGAREAALRDMRRLQSYLKDDFRLQTLAGSPFGPDMHSVQSELMLALLDLENNMLVSI